MERRPKGSISKVFYKRLVRYEQARAIHLARGLESLNHSQIRSMLGYFGLQPREFSRLLRDNFQPIGDPLSEKLYNSQGELTEEAEVRVARTRAGRIEVTDSLMYPAAAISPAKMHLRTSLGRGFNTIYVVEGRATLRLYNGVELSLAGSYFASEGYTDLDLAKDDLVMAQAGVAMKLSLVEESFRIRYLCLPPWSEAPFTGHVREVLT